MRRQFRLPEADEAYLEALGLPWETGVDGVVQWLLIHDRPVPAGYNHTKALTAIQIPASYPDVQLDMVYFLPALARADGGQINALSSQPIDGKSFQRWSRHRTSENPWRAGEDDLAGHLTLVDHWLLREVGGRKP